MTGLRTLHLAAAAALLGLLGPGGCVPPAPPAGAARSADELVLAQVVDESDALAWSAQLEGAALELLLGRPAPGAAQPGTPPPGREELLRVPAAHRGTAVSFAGRLVWSEPLAFQGEGARLGALHRGVILTADGNTVAFVSRAERPPLTEAVAAEARIPVPLPAVGAAVRVSGLFMKRWAALSPSGQDYLVMPLVAAGPVETLAGAEAEALAGVKVPAGAGLRPIPAPEIWRRPVVELPASGALRLDGRTSAIAAIEEALAQEAARLRNPLGDSALAVVVLAEAGAPPTAAEALRKLPASLGAKCIWRAAPAAASAGGRR